MDDAALVAGAIGGDQDAFGSIYDRYGAPIHDFLCALLRDRDDAADVFHDTFLVAGARLHQLRDPTRLRPWLYAIARHEGLRRIKARSRLEPLGDIEVIATGAEAADVASQGELVELVAAAAEGLSPRDRTVLDLHLRQGLDGQELGDAMGVSANHAYVLLSRLRDQVERSLGALLVTRLGREDCAGLEVVLAGWDGRFSPLMRKRVSRHVDDCVTCSDVRTRAVSPLALLAALPPIALPDQLRDGVLGDVELVSHRGRAWPARRGGFPPPMEARRRRRVVAATAAASLFLLVGGASIGANHGPRIEPVVSDDEAEVPGPPLPDAGGAVQPTGPTSSADGRPGPMVERQGSPTSGNGPTPTSSPGKSTGAFGPGGGPAPNAPDRGGPGADVPPGIDTGTDPLDPVRPDPPDRVTTTDPRLQTPTTVAPPPPRRDLPVINPTTTASPPPR